MKIFDISVPIQPNLPVWPGDPQIVLERYRKLSKGDPSNDSRLACSVHSGTHVDAPAHFIEDGLTVEQLALEILVGTATLVEFPEIDIITPDLLENLKLQPQTKRLLLKTKNSDLWADPEHQFNPDFVALSAESAAWMIRKGIQLVGIDYLSIQMFNDAKAPTHQILLEAGIIIIEGLNLREVRPGFYQLICLPIKLVDSEGAPARAVLIEE
ncbi:MAG: cyclase family protein [Desulfobacterales bacterium]|nr:MAG: cyclase family protein [Desulfobacterales bacterium]